MNEKTEKICPFLKSPCAKENCQLYNEKSGNCSIYNIAQAINDVKAAIAHHK